MRQLVRPVSDGRTGTRVSAGTRAERCWACCGALRAAPPRPPMQCAPQRVAQGGAAAGHRGGARARGGGGRGAAAGAGGAPDREPAEPGHGGRGGAGAGRCWAAGLQHAHLVACDACGVPPAGRVPGHHQDTILTMARPPSPRAPQELLGQKGAAERAARELSGELGTVQAALGTLPAGWLPGRRVGCPPAWLAGWLAGCRAPGLSRRWRPA